MKKPKHVPGPWWVEVHNKVTTIESQHYTITNDIGNDNADLVAASPDLYEFARSIALQPCSGDDCEKPGHDGGICDPCAARKVLAKVEGRHDRF